MFCFYNDGKSNKVVSDDYTAQSGEVLFTSEPGVADLAAKFANYAAVATATQNYAQSSLAYAALSDSDSTMGRIQEAVTLGLTTMQAADVVAYVSYRRVLRAYARNPSGSLPAKPPYPAGT